jgi:SH3-like domain-containing protein
MRLMHCFAMACLLPAAIGTAHALEFKSVGAAPAILYDTPSDKGRKLFVAPRGMPVEVVLTYGQWYKVRDVSGDLVWVPAKALSAKRTVITNAASARVRSATDDGSQLVFTADKGVVLELVDTLKSGWVKVRHQDGQVGFVRTSEVWGE